MTLKRRLDQLERGKGSVNDEEYAADLIRRFRISEKAPTDRTPEEERWIIEFDEECRRNPRIGPTADSILLAIFREADSQSSFLTGSGIKKSRATR